MFSSAIFGLFIRLYDKVNATVYKIIEQHVVLSLGISYPRVDLYTIILQREGENSWTLNMLDWHHESTKVKVTIKKIISESDRKRRNGINSFQNKETI